MGMILCLFVLKTLTSSNLELQWCEIIWVGLCQKARSKDLIKLPIYESIRTRSLCKYQASIGVSLRKTGSSLSAEHEPGLMDSFRSYAVLKFRSIHLRPWHSHTPGSTNPTRITLAWSLWEYGNQLSWPQVVIHSNIQWPLSNCQKSKKAGF